MRIGRGERTGKKERQGWRKRDGPGWDRNAKGGRGMGDREEERVNDDWRRH